MIWTDKLIKRVKSLKEVKSSECRAPGQSQVLRQKLRSRVHNNDNAKPSIIFCGDKA